MPKIPYNKRKDGRYYKQIVIGVDENGKRKVKTFYDKDWRALDKKVREFMLNFEQGRYVDKSITLGECIDMWIKGKCDISYGTKKHYEVIIGMIKPIAHIQIDKLKPMQIEQLYTDLYNRGVRASIKHVASFLRRIYRFAINNQLAQINVAERAQVPRLPKTTRRALTIDEREALLKAFSIFNEFERAYVGIAYYAGLRRNEILALTKQDVDFGEDIIRVSKTLVYDERADGVVQNHPKTRAGNREVPMCEKLKDILSSYINGIHSGEDRLFTTTHGKNISRSVFEYRWKNIVKKINMFMPDGEVTNITSHYLRHNWATDLIYAGVPIKSVQYVMGHENIAMTLEVYTDARIDNQAVITTLNNYWS